MNEQENETPTGSLKLGDIYFVVFRHLWLILFCSAAGMLAALYVYLHRQHLYESTAKVMVLYVLESQALNLDSRGARVLSPDTQGNTIMSAEREILTSEDLAGKVVELIGPERILRKAGGGTNRLSAVQQIVGNLDVEVLNKGNGNVLQITYRNPDPEAVQPVLAQLIDSYHEKHLQIHQPVSGNDDYFRKQKDEVGGKLQDAELQLGILKSQTLAFLPEEDKKILSEQRWKIRREIWAAESQLADQKAAAQALDKLAPKTNNVPQSVAEAAPPNLDDYRELVADLEVLRKRERKYLDQMFYTPAHPVMVQLRAKMAELQKRQDEMERANPRLATWAIPSLATNLQPSETSIARSDVAGLEARLAMLKRQLEQFETNSVELDRVETKIAQLQRSKDLWETNYRYLEMKVAQARVDDSLGAGKISNISTIQQPSIPLKSPGKTKKNMGMALAGGILGGFALAFFIEWFLDQTVKRPEEVETKLRLPLFLSIPQIGNGDTSMPMSGFRWLAARALRAANRSTVGANGASDGALLKPPLTEIEAVQRGGLETVPVARTTETSRGLNVYYAALRDRLMTYFEVRNMRRKPKMVAVTSCGEGAGVTTLASGLATLLSETGDGRVLLVDMNVEGGAVHPFYRGKLGCGLTDALEEEKRETALVQDNLYMVKAGENGTDPKLPLLFSKQFLTLMPKFKASDYDYILFDMPPVSQSSATPRLAGMMDMVLLVLEAEKTQREAAKRAHNLLRDAKATVATVLNKRRFYVPSTLQQEI